MKILRHLQDFSENNYDCSGGAFCCVNTENLVYETENYPRFCLITAGIFM